MGHSLHKPVRPRQLCLNFWSGTDGSLGWKLFPTERGGNLTGNIDFKDVDDAANDVKRKVTSLVLALDPSERFSARHRAGMAGQLRSSGIELAKVIFGNSLAKVAAILSGSSVRHVEMAVPDRIGKVLPIEFCMLPTGPDGALEYLGHRCVLVQRPPLNEDIVVPPELSDQLGLGGSRARVVGYAEDGRLHSSCVEQGVASRSSEDEVYVLAPLVEHVGLIEHAPALQAGRRGTSPRMLKDWLSRRRDVLHFNCHSDDARGERVLRVRDGFEVTAADLRSPADAGPTDVYVGLFAFLNGCSTGYGSSGLNGSLACTLLEHGAGAVACSFGPLCDAHATEFAREFYTRLAVEGTTILDAMLDARMGSYRAGGHPLGLLFSFLGNEAFIMGGT